MRTRWLTSSVAVAAVGLLAATGCSEQAAAIQVGDSHLSHSDLMDEVAELRGAAGTAGVEGDGVDEGSYPQEFVGQVVAGRVVYMLTAEIFEQEDRVLRDADREVACTSLLTELAQTEMGTTIDPPPGADICGALLEQLGLWMAPEWYQDQVIDMIAMDGMLQEELGPRYSVEAADDVDIRVSSRYGTWDDATFAAGQPPEVLPPDGPLVQRDDEEPGIDLGDLGEMGIDPDDLVGEGELP